MARSALLILGGLLLSAVLTAVLIKNGERNVIADEAAMTPLDRPLVQTTAPKVAASMTITITADSLWLEHPTGQRRIAHARGLPDWLALEHYLTAVANNPGGYSLASKIAATDTVPAEQVFEAARIARASGWSADLSSLDDRRDRVRRTAAGANR